MYQLIILFIYAMRLIIMKGH